MKNKVLELDEETAVRLYPNASVEFKELLEKNFGKRTFIKDITQIVKCLRSACEVAGEDYDDLLEACRHLPTNEAGFKKLKIWVKALRGNWIPDYDDHNEKKWFAYHKKEAKGFVVDGTLYDYWATSVVGVPALALPEEKLARYLGQQALKEYNEWYSL